MTIRCRHTLRATGICPQNGLPDEYLISVYPRRFLACEDVVAACELLLERSCFQEVFTQSLANSLGCKVRTIGRHLHNGVVEVRCICCPENGEST